ncbi:serine hydrolase domain-containing protein [Flavobacterium hauense]
MKRNFTIVFGLMLTLLLSSCKMGRFVYYNFANITDHKIFPSRPLHNDSVKFHFATAAVPYAPKKAQMGDKEITFEEYLTLTKTVSFVIIKNDTIQYENYFNNYSRESIVASFSMAKSVTSILIGCAIDDGYIKSVDEPVINYVPELKKNGFTETLTIKHVLQMMSGIKFEESYSNPFGDAATYYYGTNLRKAISKMKPLHEPGKNFEYSSGDTQLLGLILERSLKGKTITSYLEERIWKPIGMEYDASWSLDRKKDGLEKTFCCLNARALDFAKLGRLYLNKGNWNGKQIVSQKWVEESTVAEKGPNDVNYYKYQWWLPSTNGDFMAEGILGQYIYVNPAKKLIIVRLGEKKGTNEWESLFQAIANKY